MICHRCGCLALLLASAIFLLPRQAAAEGVSAREVLAGEAELSEQIQKKILDPILGPGKSSALARVKLEVRGSAHGSRKSGKGSTTRERRRLDPVVVSTGHIVGPRFSEDPLEEMFGEKSQNSRSAEVSASTGQRQMQANGNASVGQTAEQSKSEEETYSSAKLEILEMRLVVVYDEKLPKDRVEAAKRVLLAAYKDSLKPEKMEWISAPFAGSLQKPAPK